jgi:hypothetical protein
VTTLPADSGQPSTHVAQTHTIVVGERDAQRGYMNFDRKIDRLEITRAFTGDLMPKRGAGQDAARAAARVHAGREFAAGLPQKIVRSTGALHSRQGW